MHQNPPKSIDEIAYAISSVHRIVIDYNVAIKFLETSSPHDVA